MTYLKFEYQEKEKWLRFFTVLNLISHISWTILLDARRIFPANEANQKKTPRGKGTATTAFSSKLDQFSMLS